MEARSDPASGSEPSPRTFRSPDDIAQFVRRCSAGGECEGLLVFGLDHQLHVVGVAVNPRYHAIATIGVPELVLLAEELEAFALAIALVEPGEPRVPSEFEVRAYRELVRRCGGVGIVLLDCVVMRGDRWWSLVERARDLRAVDQ